ncbi:MAG: hypothetical protein PHQ75_05755 [Thermoguttaceae bacterium]|nr:hypothetical protein [Thermoguttaceae bacterium]
MNKLKIYLDTCVIGYLQQDNEPERMGITLAFWRYLELGKYQVFLSELTSREMAGTHEPKLSFLIEMLGRIEVNKIQDCVEVRQLKDKYIEAGVLTSNHENDLWHVAYSVVYGCDLIVSWNFRHLVNPRTIQKVNAVNIDSGYFPVQIVAPDVFLQWENNNENDG